MFEIQDFSYKYLLLNSYFSKTEILNERKIFNAEHKIKGPTKFKNKIHIV